MNEKPIVPLAATVGNTSMSERIDMAIRKNVGTGRGFFVIMVQLEGLDGFKKRRPAHVVNGLLRELFAAVRQAVHPSQFVGHYMNGVALVFDSVDVGQVDTITRRLAQLAQQVIRNGHYNDLTSRWTDILFQFLSPGTPNLLMARTGWSIYPRDGSTSGDLINRALHHVDELTKR